MSFNDKQIQIINTAEKFFAQKGYDGTSVRDIADEAGVNIAMISYYFGSKEKLMQAVFQHRTEHIVITMENLLKDDKLTPFEKMNVVIDEYIARVLNKQQFFKLMVCEQMMEKNSIVINLLNELKKKNGELVEKLIQEGQKKKVFKKGIDIVLLMNTLIGTVMQTFINKDYYSYYNDLASLPDKEYMDVLMKKLSNHLKDVFKATLSYEAK